VGGKILGYQHLAVETVARKGVEKNANFLNYNVLNHSLIVIKMRRMANYTKNLQNSLKIELKMSFLVKFDESFIRLLNHHIKIC
jgi:hypothetical protein